MTEKRVPVLIIGGSLVGLCTALFLRHHGVPVLLAERHPGTSIHPRTPGYNARTMELLRAAGVADAVRAAGPWRLDHTGLFVADSLTSDNHRWLAPQSMSDVSALSPERTAVLTQDRLEPVLREHAESRGAQLRFHTELVGCTPGADTVTAELRNRETGEQYRVIADYLVAADGADSGIRTRLGIGRDGPGVLEHKVGIMVRADLGDALRHKSFVIGKIDNAEVSAMVRVVGDLLSLNVGYHPERGERAADFTPQRCVAVTRAVAGIPDLAVQPLDVYPWQPSAAVARRFSDGRVFLAGDAAHVMPPSGAFGANTGIQDAYNLAWKLAFVLHGRAGAALLDSYHTERHPVATFTVDQAVARGRAWFGADYPGDTAPVDDATVMFGYRYGSGARLEDPHHPAADRGGRLPHTWLDDTARLSTVDLWAPGMVLLTGDGDAAWQPVAADLGLRTVALAPLPWQRIGGTADGAVLVRPDGFVAWRAETARQATALPGALRETLCTATEPVAG